MGERLCLALPTAVSLAIRRIVIDTSLSRNNGAGLYRAYARQMSRAFTGKPLLGGGPLRPPCPFQDAGGVLIQNLARFADAGRILHLVFVVDEFETYAKNRHRRAAGAAGPVEDGARIEGIDACCAYLARVIDQGWEDIHSALKSVDRQALVYRLTTNIEAASARSGRNGTDSRAPCCRCTVIRTTPYARPFTASRSSTQPR